MKKIASLILTAVLALSLAACNTAPKPQQSSSMDSPSSQSQQENDRTGKPFDFPSKVDTIISMSPAVTQILSELGLADKIIAVDTQSALIVTGLKGEIMQMDMFSPDIEQIVAAKPDLLFTTSMSAAGGTDPFETVRSAGVSVAQIPTALSIKDIEEDIKFISKCVGKQEKGDELIATMNETINKVKEAAKAITTKKTVLFEIAAAPDIYSFGKNVFLNELLEIAGAENILADQNDWVAVVEEAAVAKNPDVILTSVNYVDDAVGEILARKGWQDTSAVKNKQAFYIDTNSSSIPNHHVADALVEIAKAVYPEIYKDI